jgi:hypothetical protein
MWGLWWTKRHWGRFSPSISVSPTNYSTNFSIIIITRGWYKRPIGGRSAEWTLDSTPHYTNLKFLNLIFETSNPTAKFTHICIKKPRNIDIKHIIEVRYQHSSSRNACNLFVLLTLFRIETKQTSVFLPSEVIMHSSLFAIQN